MGNPIASTMTKKRTAEFGISKNGKTCVVSWVRNHATTPYATAARYTFRRLSSVKKFLGFTPLPICTIIMSLPCGAQKRQKARRALVHVLRLPVLKCDVGANRLLWTAIFF